MQIFARSKVAMCNEKVKLKSCNNKHVHTEPSFAFMTDWSFALLSKTLTFWFQQKLKLPQKNTNSFAIATRHSCVLAWHCKLIRECMQGEFIAFMAVQCSTWWVDLESPKSARMAIGVHGNSIVHELDGTENDSVLKKAKSGLQGGKWPSMVNSLLSWLSMCGT